MAQTTVTTTPAQLVPASNGAVLLKNLGPQTMWVGFDSTVTTATGYPLEPAESVSIARTNPGPQQVWAVTLTATTVAAILTGMV